ncbi:MAG: hypothetical protein HC830_01330, partial [Bacteroidetes bacterium]|nr:hypothetical protein [Bacteroidota bacterium]
KENFDLVNETKRKVAEVLKKTTSRDMRIDRQAVEGAIRDTVGEFLFRKTQRRPHGTDTRQGGSSDRASDWPAGDSQRTAEHL